MILAGGKRQVNLKLTGPRGAAGSSPLGFVHDQRRAAAHGRLLGLRHDLDARRLQRPRESVELDLRVDAELERLERIRCGSGSWGGRCPSLADYDGDGDPEGATAATMYREMGMAFWLEKAEAEIREL